VLRSAESDVDSLQKLKEQDVDPEYSKWRVGRKGIQVEDLRLAALEQVTTGNWQPRLFYKPEV